MADDIPAWQAQADVVNRLERMLQQTAAQFVEPAAGAPVTAREQALLNAANITVTGENVDDEEGFHVNAVLLVIVPPVPGADPACTLQAYAANPLGIALFSITDENDEGFTVRLLGNIATPATQDAANAATAVAFGRFGTSHMVRRNQFGSALVATYVLNGIITDFTRALDEAPAMAAAANQGRVMARAVNPDSAKHDNVLRVLEVLPLADPATRPRVLFPNITAADVIGTEISSTYSFSTVWAEIQNMIKLAAAGDAADEIKLTKAQAENLLLLRNPPMHLLNTPASLKMDITPDVFSAMIARYSTLLAIVYGDTLAHAVNRSGTDLAGLASQRRCAALKGKHLFELLTNRLAIIHIHPLIDPRTMTLANRARTLGDRLAEVLGFNFESVDFKQKLKDVEAEVRQKKDDDAAKESAAYKRRLDELERSAKRAKGNGPPSAGGGGKGKAGGGNNSNTRPVQSEAYKAALGNWQGERPPGLPERFPYPCMHFALNMSPCKGATCGQQGQKFRHNTEWAALLTKAQKTAVLAHMRTHPAVAGVEDD